jgi:hypothetical protein
VDLIFFQTAKPSSLSDLEADDGLASEATFAKLFEHLARAVQFHHGADPRSDRPVRDRVYPTKGSDLEKTIKARGQTWLKA